jgi:hypothetical protein
VAPIKAAGLGESAARDCHWLVLFCITGRVSDRSFGKRGRITDLRPFVRNELKPHSHFACATTGAIAVDRWLRTLMPSNPAFCRICFIDKTSVAGIAADDARPRSHLQKRLGGTRPAKSLCGDGPPHQRQGAPRLSSQSSIWQCRWWPRRKPESGSGSRITN